MLEVQRQRRVVKNYYYANKLETFVATFIHLQFAVKKDLRFRRSYFLC